MVKRPVEVGAFEFAVMAGLRAAQLTRGCIAQVPVGTHKSTTTAQLEMAALVLRRLVEGDAAPVAPPAA